MASDGNEISTHTKRLASQASCLGEVEGFQERVAKVEKILLQLSKDPEPELEEAISVSCMVPRLAHELARFWNAKPYSVPDEAMIQTVKRIKKLSSSLMDPRYKFSTSDFSTEMKFGIIGIANADLYRKGLGPKKGRPQNRYAKELAKQFLSSYEILTGREAGVNVDHDFVMTLGDIFAALDFDVNAQNYAKLAVKLARSDEGK